MSSTSATAVLRPSPARASAPARPTAAARRSNLSVPMPLLIMFTRQLATMYKSGIAIVRALEVLAHQAESPDFQMVIFAINSDLLKGKTFSASLQQYPRIFNPLYISMVKIGEMEGDLGEAMERVAEFLEKDYAIRRKVQAAMTYPVIVFFFAVLVAFGMFNFLLPHFVKIFEEMNAELPFITRMLMSAVRVAQSPWFMMGAPIFLVIYYVQFKRYIDTEVGRWRFDQLKLKIPIFGPIFRKVAIARLARSLSTLIMAGINTILSMELAGEASGNDVFRRHMKRASQLIANGRSLSYTFGATQGLFPGIVVQMVGAGEESGKMDGMLDKLANYYEVEVDHTLSGLASLLEPILILGTGLMVGFIVLAIFLPLYGFMNNL